MRVCRCKLPSRANVALHSGHWKRVSDISFFAFDGSRGLEHGASWLVAAYKPGESVGKRS